LLKASLLQPSSPRLGCSGAIPGSPRTDASDARCHSPLRASFLEQTLAGGGSEVERRVSSHINDGGSQQRGATEFRRRMHVEVCTPGGGTFCSHGGIIGRIRKFMHILTLKMALRYDGGGDSCVCT
jgi:hypothetical protein